MARPKEYKIPSRSWGVSANEAADILITAKEIEMNKPLHKAALADLKKRKKAADAVINKKK